MTAAPTRSGLRPLARYLGVGALATAAHYAALVAAVEWGHWPAWLASGAGAVFGAQLAYAGNRRYTFGHHGSLVRSWPRFQATAMAGAVVGMGIVALAVRAGLHYLLGQVVATGVAVLLTYAINRGWTFAPTPERE